MPSNPASPAASIIAKEHRDRLYARGWRAITRNMAGRTNMGYGTPEHLAALATPRADAISSSKLCPGGATGAHLGQGMMSGFTASDVPDQTGQMHHRHRRQHRHRLRGRKTAIGQDAMPACCWPVVTRARRRRPSPASAPRYPGADLAFLPCDQADLASIRRAAEIAAAGTAHRCPDQQCRGHVPAADAHRAGVRAAIRGQSPRLFRRSPACCCPSWRRPPVRASSSPPAWRMRAGNIDWDDLNAETTATRARVNAYSRQQAGQSAVRGRSSTGGCARRIRR